MNDTQHPQHETLSPRARHEANRAAWNEAAVRYAERVEDTVAFLRRGGSSLHPVERANLQRAGLLPLRPWCQVAVHLQCASGRDTLSLWNEGAARVVGVDISDLHIENARRTSEALGAPAAWHRCDVLDAPRVLDGTADLVYTGRGALCWLHDIDAWGRAVARLLKPGGVFHVYDDHPVLWLFDVDAEEFVPTGFDYFSHVDVNRGWGANYIGDLGRPAEQLHEKHERCWPLSAVFGALTGAGLVVEHLGEHTEEYWDVMPNLRAELRGRVPATFSLLARRPGGAAR